MKWLQCSGRQDWFLGLLRSRLWSRSDSHYCRENNCLCSPWEWSPGRINSVIPVRRQEHPVALHGLSRRDFGEGWQCTRHARANTGASEWVPGPPGTPLCRMIPWARLQPARPQLTSVSAARFHWGCTGLLQLLPHELHWIPMSGSWAFTHCILGKLCLYFTV